MKIDRAEDHSLGNRLRAVKGGETMSKGKETILPVDAEAEKLRIFYLNQRDAEKRKKAKETLDAYVLLHGEQLSKREKQKYDEMFGIAA